MTESPLIGTLFKQLRIFLKKRFDLSEGKASQTETSNEIKQNVVFKGANLWILMFAIMVASVGLDVNSTAVVIGAMLISPLMGPIMGIGLGVGTNDFELIINALKNLGIAVVISVLTSALYFWISPLDEAQSELLARTSPTLWDVLIALFGGFAGIVAGSRKEKTTAIPGVAIATALMPPLCTAGFGLGTAQWAYFVGALYLFLINSVFISLATYIMVRALRFRPKEFLDAEREQKVKRYITLFVVMTIIPSVYTAFHITKESFFRRNANEFINQEFGFENSQVIGRKLEYHRKGSSITVTLFGERISEEILEEIEEKMPDYNLDKMELRVMQGRIEQTGVDLETIELLNQQLRSGIIEDLYQRNEAQIKNRDDRIRVLENELIEYRKREIPVLELVDEIKVINSNVTEISIAPAILSQVDSIQTDTLYLAYLNFKRRPSSAEVQKMEDWLKARLNIGKIKVVQSL
jgi:uncharacterized hydrophobic protein (TIGR00271 family)